MNCMKNPRMKHKREAEKLTELFRLNLVHMGVMLRCSNAIFPGLFSLEKCAAFVGEYTETAAEFDCEDDDDLRDRRIEELIEDVPYITHAKIRELLTHFAVQARGISAEIYSGPYFFEMLEENLLLMFMQAHYGYGVGEKRFAAICDGMLATSAAGAIEWLEDVIGEKVQYSPGDIYDTLKMLADHRKRERKSQATLKEQYQARRELEALKKYQEEICRGKRSS